jgi:hypothetical protein
MRFNLVQKLVSAYIITMGLLATPQRVQASQEACDVGGAGTLYCTIDMDNGAECSANCAWGSWACCNRDDGCRCIAAM